MPRKSLHDGMKWLLVGAGVLVLGAACDLPFGLGLASTRALEDGAASALNDAGSFEISGTYLESDVSWTIDLQLARPESEHLVVSEGSGGQKLEAVLLGKDGYFRGRDLLAQHLGTDPVSQGLISAV